MVIMCVFRVRSEADLGISKLGIRFCKDFERDFFVISKIPVFNAFRFYSS